MSVRTAVVELLKEDRDTRIFFKRLCHRGTRSLRSQAWQFRDELRDRGQSFKLEEVEDVLFDLARELFPESPAADWCAWADLIFKDALARISEQYADLSDEERSALDLSATWDANDLIVAAGAAEDRTVFREAVRQWEHDAIQAAKSLEKSTAGETGAA